MPDIDTPYMTISVTVPGASATYIEEEIIEDIEKTVLTFSDVSEVRSFVFDNYAISYILFNYSADDPDQTSLDIFTKVNELELDDSISKIEYESAYDDPHIIFSVHSENLTQTELEAYALAFKNDLITLDNIGTVEIDNAFSEEVVIHLDIASLSMYELTITEIYQILYANSLNIPLGGISTVYGTISINGNVTFDELSDLEGLVIIPEILGVTPEVTLGDLSTIALENTSSKEYTYNDEKAIFLSVFFEKDIDFTKMGDDVLELKDDGDSIARFSVNAGGTAKWSSGSGSTDANLYRSGVGTLATDNTFVATAGLKLGSDDIAFVIKMNKEVFG